MLFSITSVAVRPLEVAFMLLSLAVYLPVVALRMAMEGVSVALPESLAARMVLKPEHDLEMGTGLAIIAVVLAQFVWGVFGGIDSVLGAWALHVVTQCTFNLNADHYSLYMHTESHKYWTPGGTWTFLGKKSALGLANVPIMDYLWFLTGYPPAWGTIEHAKVHHIWHTMHPLDPDYIFDQPRNSVWAFLRFNLRAMFLNMLNLGVMRIYAFWPEVRVLRSARVRGEVERQLPTGLGVLAYLACRNPHMLWFVAFNMIATNVDLNINTWVQHAFINHDDGKCNAWNSTTLAHDDMTWSGCAEHLKHHLSPAQSQESFVEWYKSGEARKLRRRYGFHVFDATSTTQYYRLFWAIASGDYAWLERAWVPIECSLMDGDEIGPTKVEVAIERTEKERIQLRARFKVELERLFAEGWTAAEYNEKPMTNIRSR